MSSGIVAEIKSKLPVLDVVGDTVALKRAGTVYKGLCPFHTEKTPSFIVSPDRETWHCFGCGEHGDIFTFVMRRDGLEFREALGRLAEKAGVELSERTAREDRHRARLREALEGAVAWYREVLRQAHQAERARAYLAERGLSEATLERFGIGYAPNTWDALTRRLRERGFRDDELTGAGLASPSPRGGIHDRFRGRIMIPIRDASGRAVGMGGRIMPGAEGPKYLNSPATAIFDKSRTLYGIDLAKAAIRREKLAVIVEGYTDVMAAHQAGFTNVVASLGTALTRGQVELATRYADGVALAYDVDLAGEAATQRGLLAELGPDTAVSKVRVVRIPAGKDPDELLRTDPDSWREAVAAAKPVLEYFMERAVAEADPGTPAGRREVAERVLGLLRQVANPIERDAHVPELARLTGIDERVLRESMARRPVERAVAVRPDVDGEPADVRADDGLRPEERRFLSLALRFPALMGEPGDDPPIRDMAARQLLTARRAFTVASPAGDLRAFVDSLGDELQPTARELLSREGSLELDRSMEAARPDFLAAARRVRSLRLDEEIGELNGLIGSFAEETDEVRALRRQLTELHRRKQDIIGSSDQPVAEAAGARRS